MKHRLFVNPTQRIDAPSDQPVRSWRRFYALASGNGSSSVRRRERSRTLRIEMLENRSMLSASVSTTTAIDEQFSFEPSAEEQELLELINRMRMNPQAELDYLFTSVSPELVAVDPSADYAIGRYGDPTAAELLTDWAELEAAAPLSWDFNISEAAELHNQKIIDYTYDYNTPSHQYPNEPSLEERIVNAGYTDWSYAGENLMDRADSMLHAHSAFAIDWMIADRGHRTNLMNADYSNVGIAVQAETDPDTRVGPYVVTVDFASPGASAAPASIMGVVYDDYNGDGFYTAGEGISDVTIRVESVDGAAVTSSWSAGGYQLPVPDGVYTVTATGDALPRPIVFYGVQVMGQNVKVDFNLRDMPNYQPELDLSGPDTPGSDRDLNYIEHSAPVLVASESASLLEPDGEDIAWARFTITNLADPTLEMLHVDTSGTNITFHYNDETGVMDLTGLDTAAHYESVIRSLTYANLAEVPVLGTRSIELLVSDGANESDPVFASIDILPEIIPTISVADATVQEGDDQLAVMQFTLQLSEATNRDIILQFSTRDDTALAGIDYMAMNGTLTIPANQTEAIVAVPVVGDLAEESDLAFFVDFQSASTPLLAMLENSQAQGIIEDDDRPIDLGQIATYAENDVAIADGRHLYRFTAQHDGNYVIFADHVPDVANDEFSISIFQEPFTGLEPPLVSGAAGADGSLQLGVPLLAGQSYLVEVKGVTTDLDWSLENPVRKDQGQLQVRGTAGNDQFMFRLDSTPGLWWQGIWIPFDLSMTDTFDLLGGGGSDTVTIVASDDSHQITLDPAAGNLLMDGTSLDFSEVDNLILESGSGYDILTLVGTPQDDLLMAGNGNVKMITSGRSYEFQDIEMVSVDAGSADGGRDVLRLFDTPGNDRIISSFDQVSMIGDRFMISANEFEIVSINCSSGGIDKAYVYDSPYNDQLIGKSTGVMISTAADASAPLSIRQFFGLQTVTVFAEHGGIDSAQLFDSYGDDLLMVQPERILLVDQSGNQNVELYNFESVQATSLYGGNDQIRIAYPEQGSIAYALDKTGDIVTLSDQNQLVTATGFAGLMVNGQPYSVDQSVPTAEDSIDPPPFAMMTAAITMPMLQSGAASSSSAAQDPEPVDIAMTQMAEPVEPGLTSGSTSGETSPDSSQDLTLNITASDQTSDATANDAAMETIDWNPLDDTWNDWQSGIDG